MSASHIKDPALILSQIPTLGKPWQFGDTSSSVNQTIFRFFSPDEVGMGLVWAPGVGLSPESAFNAEASSQRDSNPHDPEGHGLTCLNDLELRIYSKE